MKSAARMPPTPPENILGGVGPGDYHAMGRSTVSLLERWAGLGCSDDILDVGCGPGRTAWALSEKLGDRATFTYTGLDVVPAYIDWSLGIGLEPERFRFHLADIRTSFYNPAGATAAEDFVFPWADASFDLAIATSLFTHLLPGAVVHYLSEIARTLRPGARLFASFFLLDARGRAATATGFTYPTFSFPIEHGLLHEAAVAESGVAHDEQWLLEALAGAGLRVSAVHPGGWKSPPGEYHQDVIVAVRE